MHGKEEDVHQEFLERGLQATAQDSNSPGLPASAFLLNKYNSPRLHLVLSEREIQSNLRKADYWKASDAGGRQLLLFVCVPMSTVAAEDSSVTHQHPDIPTSVEGSKRQKQIADFVTQRHFILAASIPSSPSSAATERQKAILRRLNLDPFDQSALITALSGIRDQVDVLAWSEAAGGGDYSGRQARLDQIVASGWGARGRRSPRMVNRS